MPTLLFVFETPLQIYVKLVDLKSLYFAGDLSSYLLNWMGDCQQKREDGEKKSMQQKSSARFDLTVTWFTIRISRSLNVM